MKQADFERYHRNRWLAFALWLDFQRPKKGQDGQRQAPFPLTELPDRYRELCQHLALARDRHYTSQLVDELHRLVQGGHMQLYGSRSGQGFNFFRFMAQDFPRLVRQEWPFTVTGLLLFFVPLFGLIIAMQWYPGLADYLIPQMTQAQMEHMYRPGNEVTGFTREAPDDILMWGYYIYHNISIDFQCFAGGILFGLGALFYTVYNGVIIGAIAGYLTHKGYIVTFWSFVAGHSSFELIGAALAGAAGLELGYALVAPGPYSRLHALKRRAQIAVRLLGGAATLTFIAAFIEGFWSPQTFIPPMVKYVFGGSMWLLLSLWLLLGGRRAA
ncbi:stage II sporulation protein M [Leeia aquatica]|uniref:Stage II sporulation protein M n=1 Tax=Leeia aquatica TaxID=2725557 RepID=A0A847SH72_9NEIS|nr:stage II sporulation protein M [Leeia aquatica]NLR75272.1 stage II sporulation protein M [Leeia aquatica]